MHAGCWRSGCGRSFRSFASKSLMDLIFEAVGDIVRTVRTTVQTTVRTVQTTVRTTVQTTVRTVRTTVRTTKLQYKEQQTTLIYSST